MTKQILGIDVSKATLDVVLLTPDHSYHQVFDNDPKGFVKLKNWLTRYDAGYLHVCMEATGQYGLPVAEVLYSWGHDISIVNPFCIKSYANARLSRNKTDKLDAAIIADFCLSQNPRLWTPPHPVYKDLRYLTRYHDKLKGMRQQERNRLQSGITSSTVIHAIRQHIAYLDQSIKEIEKSISDLIHQHDFLYQKFLLLTSIKGIGKVGAAVLLAEIQDIHLFGSASQLAAFAGVTPTQHSSGSSGYKPSRMSKAGNVYLRKALFFPAIVAKQHNPIIRSFCERLAARGKAPMSCIGAAMRKLLHIAFGVLTSGTPFDPNFLSTP
jgi:transposase